MKIESPPAGLEALEGAEIFNYGHLPIAAAYCRGLGIVEGVNDIVSSRMDLQPGVVVQAMVLDTLSGRSPLYRLKEFRVFRRICGYVGRLESAGQTFVRGFWRFLSEGDGNESSYEISSSN